MTLAVLSWLTSTAFLLFGAHFLIQGTVGHALSGGGGFALALLPAGFFFIAGMACYSSTTSSRKGEENRGGCSASER
jgi:hypothetical protein